MQNNRFSTPEPDRNEIKASRYFLLRLRLCFPFPLQATAAAGQHTKLMRFLPREVTPVMELRFG